jgi:23S rRNA pseudouridine2605 synthase
VEKEYLVEVRGVITRPAVRSLISGVALEDGPARALRTGQVQRVGGRSALTVVVAEGRKRLLRRMLGAVGFPVTRLVRIRVGPVRLEGLPAGALRTLRPDEVAALYRATGLSAATLGMRRQTSPDSRGQGRASLSPGAKLESRSRPGPRRRPGAST